MPSTYTNFGIIGAGAWGTALAIAMQKSGVKNVTLVAHGPGLAAMMAEKRENIAYLKGISLDPALRITADVSQISDCDAVILATPAQFVRETCKKLKPLLTAPRPILIAAKGIESHHYRLMSEVAAEEIPTCPVLILSGPSFAHEVARGLPTALTLAGETDGEALAHTISSNNLRLYTTDDIIGTQIGGAVKNVLAIACGIAAGRGMGENARAALITRGLAEMMRLGLSLGARAETLMGLSGMGDLVLTCSSIQSRNMSLGFALGKGETLDSILASRNNVTEGIATAAATLGLARRHGVDMPIVSAIDRILRDHASIDDMINNLLSRPLRNEAA
jgi:glycerol-3-phosphate dehydrogenase (NAD(P)+)